MHKEHGISFGTTRVGEDFFLKLTLKGKLTHEDYETVIPMIENALIGVKEPKVKALVDAREFDGYEIRAAWDDLKFGLKHNKEFTKLALVGDKKWEEYAVKISNWFMSGDMRYFEDMPAALAWLNAKEEKNMKMTTIEKEFSSRKEEIKKELKFLFKANIRITDWDVPEVDSTKAAKTLHTILQEGLDEIEKDIKEGKFD